MAILFNPLLGVKAETQKKKEEREIERDKERDEKVRGAARPKNRNARGGATPKPRSHGKRSPAEEKRLKDHAQKSKPPGWDMMREEQKYAHIDKLVKESPTLKSIDKEVATKKAIRKGVKRATKAVGVDQLKRGTLKESGPGSVSPSLKPSTSKKLRETLEKHLGGFKKKQTNPSATFRSFGAKQAAELMKEEEEK